MRFKRRALVTLALVLALTAASVGMVLAQEGQQAILRFVHAVPSGPPVDVFVDGNRVFSNVSLGMATDYAAFPAGTHSVRVVPAGAGAQGQALIDTVVDLGADSYNTLAAVGQPDSVQPLTLVNSSTLPVTTQARVRAVHASPDAPAVDVAVRGGPVLFQGVTFPNAADYRLVDAGTVDLEIREANTDKVVLRVSDVNLNGATVYSIFVLGLAGGQPPLRAVVVVDAPPLQACQVLVRQTPVPGVAPVGTPQPGTPTATPRVTVTPSPGTPTVTGTPPTGTPTTTGTPPTGTPTTTGTPPTGTPTTGATPSPGATATVPRPTEPPLIETPLATPLFIPQPELPTILAPSSGRRGAWGEYSSQRRGC